jgi:hypothetical protein
MYVMRTLYAWLIQPLPRRQASAVTTGGGVMSQQFDRNQITEVVILGRATLDDLELNMLQQAFPNATLRRASDAETNSNATELFAAITYPRMVGVVKFHTLTSMFVRNGLSFVYLLDNEGELSVNRGEGGIVSRVYPELEA